MSSDRLNGIPASGHTHMFDMSSPDVRRSTATHDVIKLRSLAGSAGRTRSSFAPVQVMSIEKQVLFTMKVLFFTEKDQACKPEGFFSATIFKG